MANEVKYDDCAQVLLDYQRDIAYAEQMFCAIQTMTSLRSQGYKSVPVLLNYSQRNQIDIAETAYDAVDEKMKEFDRLEEEVIALRKENEELKKKRKKLFGII